MWKPVHGQVKSSFDTKKSDSAVLKMNNIYVASPNANVVLSISFFEVKIWETPPDQEKLRSLQEDATALVFLRWRQRDDDGEEVANDGCEFCIIL